MLACQAGWQVATLHMHHGKLRLNSLFVCLYCISASECLIFNSCALSHNQKLGQDIIRDIFGSGVSREPYKSLCNRFCHRFCSKFWSLWLVDAVHAGYIAQLSLVDNTEARVAPGSCTVLYKQLMTCTQSVHRLEKTAVKLFQAKCVLHKSQQNTRTRAFCTTELV